MTEQDAIKPTKRERLKPCILVIVLMIFFCIGILSGNYWRQNAQVYTAHSSVTKVNVTPALLSGKRSSHRNVKFRHEPDHRQRLTGCFIIGVRKGGTRALLRLLDLHPNIRAYRGRELHFFDSDAHYSKGLTWYKRKLPFSWPDQITIEKTPAYFHTLSVPRRMRLTAPNAKFLLVVKDPVVRSISDYAQLREKNIFRGNGYPSFEKSVFLPGGSVNVKYSAIKFGLYNEYFVNWLNFFDRKQIHIVDGEELIRNPLVELRKVESFLGIRHKIGESQIVFDSDKESLINFQL